MAGKRSTQTRDSSRQGGSNAVQKSNPSSTASRSSSSEEQAPRAKRRRNHRVIPNSDSSEHDDGETVQAPAGASAPQVAEGQDSPDLDALLDELNAFMATQLEEHGPEEEVVETDDYIPGPDDELEDHEGELEADGGNLEAWEDEPEDDEDSAPCHEEVPTSDSPPHVERFADILRLTLMLLAGWAFNEESESFKKKPRAERAMTFGFWALLQKVSIDYLMSLFLPAIPLKVQELFLKSKWTEEDFLDLPNVGRSECQGLYGNIATRNGKRPKAYVGCAKILKNRVGVHKSNARAAKLRKEHSKSLHYLCMREEGTRFHFKKFAAFKTSIEVAYLLLLEGIFMILLNTFHLPWNGGTKWASQASYDLIQSIRQAIGLPSTPWDGVGLNAAWPLYQGFWHKAAREMSPCCNPDCGEMTHPCSKIPEGMAKRYRRLFQPGDPLGGYLCPECAGYRDLHKELPSKAVLDRAKERRDARAAAGDDAPCHTCGRLESQFGKVERRNGSGKTVWHHLRHCIPRGLPGKLLCSACRQFFEEHDRERNPQELEDFLASVEAQHIRASGTAKCHNCELPEGHWTLTRSLIFSGKLKKWLCVPCNSMYTKKGRLPAPKTRQQTTARKEMERDIANGLPVFCGHCASQWDPAKRRFTLGGETLRPVCRDCYDKKGLR